MPTVDVSAYLVRANQNVFDQATRVRKVVADDGVRAVSHSHGSFRAEADRLHLAGSPEAVLLSESGFGEENPQANQDFLSYGLKSFGGVATLPAAFGRRHV